MWPLEQRDLSIAAMRCFVKWNWILDVPTIAPLPATSLLKSPHHQTFDDLEAALSGGLFRFKQACTSAHGPTTRCAAVADGRFRGKTDSGRSSGKTVYSLEPVVLTRFRSLTLKR